MAKIWSKRAFYFFKFFPSDMSKRTQKQTDLVGFENFSPENTGAMPGNVFGKCWCRGNLSGL